MDKRKIGLLAVGVLLLVVATAEDCFATRFLPQDDGEVLLAIDFPNTDYFGVSVGALLLDDASGTVDLEVRTRGQEVCPLGSHYDWDVTRIFPPPVGFFPFGFDTYAERAQGLGGYYGGLNIFNPCFLYQDLWWYNDGSWRDFGQEQERDSSVACHTLREDFGCAL